MKRGITTTVIALLAIAIILAGIAAYGWLRPIEEKQVTVEKSLEDLAKLEGSLTIYGVTDTPDFETYVKPVFLSNYPWCTINYLGLSPPEIAARISSEYTAGQVGADIASDTLGAIEGAILQGALAPYDNPMVKFSNFTADEVDTQHRWQQLYNIPIVLMYNTQLVTGVDVPQQWQDLTLPKWNGKIVFDEPRTLNVAGALFAHLYPVLGNASWTTLMQGLEANNPVKTQSAGDAFDYVARGECSLGIALLNDYIAGKKAVPPVPVEVAWIDPITTLPIIVGMTTNAPHPNCAKLFLQWYATVQGQLTTAITGRVPPTPVVAQATVLKGILPEGKTIVTAASNNMEYYSNPTKWSDIFQSIFG